MIYIERNTPLKRVIWQKFIAGILVMIIALIVPMGLVLDGGALKYKSGNLLGNSTIAMSDADYGKIDLERIAQKKIQEKQQLGEISEWKFDNDSFIKNIGATDILENKTTDLETEIKSCIKLYYNQYELKIDDATFCFKSESEAQEYKDKIHSSAEIAKTTVEKLNLTSQIDLDKKYDEINRPVEIAKVETSTNNVTSRGTGQARSTYNGGAPLDSYSYISSGYRTASRRNHTGTDFAAPMGTNIRAWNSGTVIRASWNGNYGKCIEISHGNGLVTRYAHCSAINVSVGQVVSKGDIIGHVGSTGNSTGPHLHFEVMINGVFQNPMSYL